MRVQITLTGSIEEAKALAEFGTELQRLFPRARVRAYVLDPLVDTGWRMVPPPNATFGMVFCRECGSWYPAGEGHTCLPELV